MVFRGNNNYLGNTPAKANVFPYGISFFPSPTGRFSDGRLIPDFLAKHANLSFPAPYLQPGNGDQFQDGVNFASGGSGALAQTFQGGEVYKTGGRKFGFLNVAVLGCLPGLRILTKDSDCVEDASVYANLHNEALLRSLKLLEKELPAFKYSVFDSNSCVQLRIDHPSVYGYKETRGACCGSGRLRGEFSCGGKRGIQEYEVCDNRDEYVFWDAFHFTEKVHHQCADDMWNSPNNSMYYGSYTIKDLFYLT